MPNLWGCLRVRLGHDASRPQARVTTHICARIKKQPKHNNLAREDFGIGFEVTSTSLVPAIVPDGPGLQLELLAQVPHHCAQSRCQRAPPTFERELGQILHGPFENS